MHKITKLNRFTIEYRQFDAAEIVLRIYFLCENIIIDQDFKLDAISVCFFEILIEQFLIYDVGVVQLGHYRWYGLVVLLQLVINIWRVANLLQFGSSMSKMASNLSHSGQPPPQTYRAKRTKTRLEICMRQIAVFILVKVLEHHGILAHSILHHQRRNLVLWGSMIDL